MKRKIHYCSQAEDNYESACGRLVLTSSGHVFYDTELSPNWRYVTCEKCLKSKPKRKK